MQNTGKKIATWALVATTAACWASAGLLLTTTGCDKIGESTARQKDREIDTQLAKSQADREKGGEAGMKDSTRALEAAAAIGEASGAGKARAKSELAQDEVNRALTQLPEIQRRSLQVGQALWEIRRAGSEVAGVRQTGATFGALEPKEALAKVEQDRVEVKKQIDKAKADTDTAKADLDKRQQEITGLKPERQKAEADAESLTEKSAAAKGDEAMKSFREATDARIKAGTLAAQIETKSAALLPVQRNLAMAQQQQQFWENSAKELDDRQQQLEGNRTELTQQGNAANESGKKIVVEFITPNGDEKNPPPHPNAGYRLDALSKKNDEQRAAVANLLKDAIKHFDEAANAAGQYHDDLETRIGELSTKSPNAPELPALRGLAGLYDKNQYLLEKGNAQNLLADLLATKAAELQQIKLVKDELAKALPPDAKLPERLTKVDPDAAYTEAKEAYKAAEMTLEPVANATTNVDNLAIVKNAGRVALAHAHLGRYLLPSHEEEARVALKADVDQAQEAGIDLRIAREELAKSASK